MALIVQKLFFEEAIHSLDETPKAWSQRIVYLECYLRCFRFVDLLSWRFCCQVEDFVAELENFGDHWMKVFMHGTMECQLASFHS